MLLQNANILDSILYGEAPGTYAFGDSTQEPARFRLLQVPLFYKTAGSKAEDSLLVFANITVVNNEVGLLDGKMNLSALETKAVITSSPGSSKLWLAQREIQVDDSGSHFWLLLNAPRPFEDDEEGLYLQRTDDCLTEAVIVPAGKHHTSTCSFDKDVLALKDNKHLTMFSNHDEVNFLDESNLQGESVVANHIDVISCGDSDGSWVT